MALDVEPPDPPDLTNRGVPAEFEAVETAGSAADLRREELEDILRSGAWAEAVAEWAAYTDLTAEEFELAESLGLFGRIDVYWDPAQARLRATAPALDADDEAALPHAYTETTASKIETALLDLCDVVVELVERDYVDWGGSGTADGV